MALPLRMKTGFEEAPLIEGGQVVVRMLRVGFAWELRSGGGTWQMLVPFAVVDKRTSPPKAHPVVDLKLALQVATLGAGLLITRRARRVSDV